MKLKTNKTLKKRFKLTNPKSSKPKLEHMSQGITHNFSKRRQFRNFRGKMPKFLQNIKQIKKVLKALS